MPIYEYVCAACEEQIEILQKIDEKAPEKCPSCGKEGSLSKTVSGSSFQLKGGGWYKDLYASKKPVGSEKSGKSNEKKD